jgi:putative ubiquitin-RnfH superfamily antitoxin RatB of RatAB toxin-antitoxin module
MDENDQGQLNIEVAFASAESALLEKVTLPAGATLGDALQAANLEAAFPQFSFAELEVGIWGQPVTRQQQLRDGDRVEVYRGLERDPMEARRLRARRSGPAPSGSR